MFSDHLDNRNMMMESIISFDHFWLSTPSSTSFDDIHKHSRDDALFDESFQWAVAAAKYVVGTWIQY